VRSPIFDRAALDVRVVAYTMAVSFLCTLLFALVPAVKGSLWTPGQALIARTAIGQGNRWRHAMMAVEAMLSVVLLSGAALLGQNLWKLVSTPAGFNLDHLWSMRLRLPFRHEQALAPMPSRAYRAYLEKISATPGVDSAAMVTGLPIRGAVQRGILLDGDSDDLATLRRQSAWYQIVSPEYFRTMGIPMIGGRTFRDDDIGGRPEVVIVNEEFVRRYSKGRDILGRTIGRGRPQTIVGVVGDVRMSAQTTAPQPQLYASYLQSYEPNITLVVRSSLPAAELLTRVKQAIHAAYPDQAVFNVMSMDEVLTNSVAEPRFHAFLIGMFAVLALAMAGSGMYSVISCIVGQRTGEIAIRIALGAGGVDIIRTVLGATATWLVGGLAAGVALGAASSSAVRKLSQSSVSASPSLYAAVVLFFLTVTLLAVCIPMRRASRMDPAIALRCE
jgi:putative ABC transport system permease protein